MLKPNKSFTNNESRHMRIAAYVGLQTGTYCATFCETGAMVVRGIKWTGGRLGCSTFGCACVGEDTTFRRATSAEEREMWATFADLAAEAIAG